MNNHFVILISGPTATGKSDFALNLGKFLPVEIINADIGSFYEPLTIGTAKPDWKKETIPHHFFDIFNQPEHWTAPQFRKELLYLIEKIWARGNIPVVVGGSAFYIQSFFYKNHELTTPSEELMYSLEMKSIESLWKQLYEIDPDRAEKIGMHDKYRLIRALAIWKTEGRKPSECEQIFMPLAPFYFIILQRDKDELYSMINQRVSKMIDNGWCNEVQLLLDNELWVDFLIKKKLMGYDLLIQYMQGNFSAGEFNAFINLIAQRTRNYAKRQNTFLKKLAIMIQKNQEFYTDTFIRSSIVETYNITDCNIDSIVHKINHFLKKEYKHKI